MLVNSDPPRTFLHDGGLICLVPSDSFREDRIPRDTGYHIKSTFYA